MAKAKIIVKQIRDYTSIGEYEYYPVECCIGTILKYSKEFKILKFKNDGWHNELYEIIIKSNKLSKTEIKNIIAILFATSKQLTGKYELVGIK